MSIKAAFGDGDWFNNYWYDHHVKPPFDPWSRSNEEAWTGQTLSYLPVVVYPSQLTDEKTGEVIEGISFDVPGCSAEQVKVSWNKDTRILVLTGINEKLGRTYTFSINTFSQDLLEDTLTTTVENGIATVSGKLKRVEYKLKETSKVMDVPVK